jgi:hypothetical protein
MDSFNYFIYVIPFNLHVAEYNVVDYHYNPKSWLQWDRAPDIIQKFQKLNLPTYCEQLTSGTPVQCINQGTNAILVLD